MPYPAHRLILSDLPDPVAHVTVDRDELLGVLDVTDRAVISVEAGPSSSLLRIGASHADSALLTARGRGDVPRLHLSAPLWRRAVEACLGPDVTMDVRSPRRPVTLRSAYQPSFTALVMPTSVEE
jgi:hypothetical protein